MGKEINFTLNQAGGAEILKDNFRLQAMQKGIMDDALSSIRAQFFQTFGVKGEFEMVEFTTDRSTIKIRASDAKTAAILKRSPGWLNTFVNNITI